MTRHLLFCAGVNSFKPSSWRTTRWLARSSDRRAEASERMSRYRSVPVSTRISGRCGAESAKRAIEAAERRACNATMHSGDLASPGPDHSVSSETRYCSCRKRDHREAVCQLPLLAFRKAGLIMTMGTLDRIAKMDGIAARTSARATLDRALVDAH